ncbi:MAG: hypothetical protein Q9222_003632 [Ikaeria aurantiellina]
MPKGPLNDGFSPNGFARNSATQVDSPLRARTHRQNDVGTNIVGNSLEVPAQASEAGPWSAPAHLKTFDQLAQDRNVRAWSRDSPDDRWNRRPEEFQANSTYLDLLHAQLGIDPFAEPQAFSTASTKSPLNGEAPDGAASSSPSAQAHHGSTSISGQHCDNLMSYVIMANSGQQPFPVPELDQLTAVLLELRGDGDDLPSIHPSGRDMLRKYLYRRVFASDNGTSRLTLEKPFDLISVAGQLVTRSSLHDEITFFLEQRLEDMTALVQQDTEHRHEHVASNHHNGHNEPSYQAPMTAYGSDGRSGLSSSDRNVPGHQPITSKRPDNELPTNKECQNFHCRAERGLERSAHFFGSPSPGGMQQGCGELQHRLSRQTLSSDDYAGDAGINPYRQIQSVANGSAGSNPAAPVPLSALYGHPAMSVQQQQQYYWNIPQQQAQQPPASQQYLAPQGMPPGFPYFSPYHPPTTFYPGRQSGIPVAPLSPYGAQYPPNGGFTLPPFGGHFMQPNGMGHPQLAMNPFPAHSSPWLAQTSQGIQPSARSWPPASLLTHNASSRTSSPMLRSNDGSTQTRSGRLVVPQVPLLPYRHASDDMYPHPPEGTSVKLQQLIRHGDPNFALATHEELIPFGENARNHRVAEWGVLKIGNIPYTLTKQEVLGFLGRNAKILTPDLGVPIHIIMDRPTGKTMDCYVEFFSSGDAQAALNKCLSRGNQLRLQDRVVDVQMSSQDELLRELFPRAKNCTWVNGRPVITQSHEPYNTGFKSFLAREELLQLKTWVQKPHRSNYTQKSMQRPFECMISTLSKFPWSAVDYYTLANRNEMFDATADLIELLADQLSRGNEAWAPHLSESLLTELLYAGLNAPGFSEQQRWELCLKAGPVGTKVRMSPLAQYWPFEVVGRKAKMDEDVVNFYAQCLKRHPHTNPTATPFGTWTAPSNQALGLTTVGEIGKHEMKMITDMLRDVLPDNTGDA